MTRWHRVGSSRCSLNNIPLVSKSFLPLLRRHVHGFSGGPLASVSQLAMVSYVRLFFLLVLTLLCVFFPSICTTFEVTLVCYSVMMFRILVRLSFLTDVPPDLVS